MIIFILTTLIFSFFLEFLTSFWLIFDQFIFIDKLYVYIFILFFILNFFIFKNKSEFNFNHDILYKYYLFFFKTPNFFFNSVIVNFKKIFTYLIYFRNKAYIDFANIFFKKFSNKFFIIWRPLFKKFSYFGYYRANRSKWIK